MRQIIILILFLLFEALTSCKMSDSPVGQNNIIKNSKDILPLKYGNSWTYSISVHDSAGAIIPGNYADEELKIEYEKTVLTDTYYQINNFQYLDWNKFFTSINGSLYQLDGGTSPALTYKYPAALNESYRIKDDTVTIEATDLTVTVPAGTFTGCYVYRINVGYTNTGFIYRDYFCPGVGCVKREASGKYWDNNGSKYLYETVVRELKEYHIN